MISRVFPSIETDSIVCRNQTLSSENAEPFFFTLLIPVALFTIVIGYLSIVRHASFESFEDLALFDQLLWNIRHGRGPVTTVSGNMHLLFRHHFFGEHFSPILYLLAPIAGITQGPEALLIFQAFAVGMAAVPAGWWVSRIMGSSQLGVAAAWFWIAIPAIWVGVLYDFHMDCLFPFFFFGFLLTMHQRRKEVWIWAALVVSVKEDAAIYLMVTSLVTGWLYDRKRTGAILAAASLAYVLVVVQLIIPRFSPTGSHLLGNRVFTPANCGGWIEWIQAVFGNPVRWSVLGEHLFQFGFFPVMAWMSALPWLASLGIAWLSRDVWQSLMSMHYPLMSYPLLFFGMIEGLRVWDRIVVRRFPVGRSLARSGATLIISVGILLNWLDAKPRLEEVMRSASPSRASRVSKSRDMLLRIPSDISVAATQTTLAHVARRERLYLMFDPIEADSVVLQTYLPCEMSYEPDRYREHVGHFLKSLQRGRSFDISDHLIVLYPKQTDRKPPDRSYCFTEFVDSTEFQGAETEQEKDPDAINGFAVKWDMGIKQTHLSLKWPHTLASGAYLINVRARASCTEPSDVIVLQISEEQGKRASSAATILERHESYQITTIPSVVTSGVDLSIDTAIPKSCTLWIDRVWIEPVNEPDSIALRS